MNVIYNHANRKLHHKKEKIEGLMFLITLIYNEAKELTHAFT